MVDLPVVGIAGGGQLGRMMILAGRAMGFRFAVLDPDPEAPAAVLADRFVNGSLHDGNSLAALADRCDVLTYEIEHEDTDSLLTIERSGHAVRPSPATLSIIQDKLIQKETLQDAGLPVPRFVAPAVADPHAQDDSSAIGASSPRLLRASDGGLTVEDLSALGFPCVEKARRGGYDGRGVRYHGQRPHEWTPLSEEIMLEEAVHIERELAVIVARSTTGETRTYAVAEMLFDPKLNICTAVAMPARIDAHIEQQAREVALTAVKVLNGVGIFVVELFETPDGRVLINEVAPRPHNSGHLTIEACATSQFEQHLRAIAGLPLGSTALHAPAVMMNLLGPVGRNGQAVLEGVGNALGRGGSVHWYAKAEVRPGRKMGHVTALGDSVEEAHSCCESALAQLNIGTTNGQA